MEKQTLGDLSPGQSGTILSIDNRSKTVKRRLVDMGLTPGTEVKVTKIAPLGDPIEVSLRGYELSLRKEDAGQILMGHPRPRGTGAARGAVFCGRRGGGRRRMVVFTKRLGRFLLKMQSKIS